MRDRFVVRVLEARRVDERAQQIEMAGLRLVQACDQPVDGLERVPCINVEPGPAPLGPHGSVRTHRGLERSHDGRADRNHPPAGGMRFVHGAGGFGIPVRATSLDRIAEPFTGRWAG